MLVSIFVFLNVERGALLVFVDVEFREFMPRFLIPNKPATKHNNGRCIDP
jgi:hypothetical protein